LADVDLRYSVGLIDEFPVENAGARNKKIIDIEE